MSAELMRLLSNIIRTGIISEVDEESWCVRVRSGELETGWLRWNTTRAGAFNVVAAAITRRTGGNCLHWRQPGNRHDNWQPVE
ncbi:phage baseplate assembly V family protein [Escherichia coli Jurua 18/11]|nr:phage baseplate assembly V family protein [Escherichia coli Jurua 18/11]